MAELCMFGILDMYQVFQTLAKLQFQLSVGVLGKCAKRWKKKRAQAQSRPKCTSNYWKPKTTFLALLFSYLNL